MRKKNNRWRSSNRRERRKKTSRKLMKRIWGLLIRLQLHSTPAALKAVVSCKILKVNVHKISLNIDYR